MSAVMKMQALEAVLADVEKEITELEAKDAALLSDFHKAKEKFLLLDVLVHTTRSEYADLYGEEHKRASARYDEIGGTPGLGKEESRRLGFLRTFRNAIKSRLGK